MKLVYLYSTIQILKSHSQRIKDLHLTVLIKCVSPPIGNSVSHLHDCTRVDLLGAWAKWQNRLLVSSYLPVGPTARTSTWNKWSPTKRIFMKFDI